MRAGFDPVNGVRLGAVTHRIDLLRHAKSSWSDPDLADHERPLNKRGRKATKRLSDHVKSAGLRPDLVLCSSAARAVQTLEGLRPGLPAELEVDFEEGLYGASAGELLGRLQRVPEAVGWVMLVGHNPGIEGLALGLAADGSDADSLDRMRAKYPTGGLATLEFDAAWADLAPAGASLEAFVAPRQLD